MSNKTHDTAADLHNGRAPYWAALMVILAILGLSTNWIKTGGFWNSYVLDATGPAWNYILFRGLFTARKENLWIRFFSPLRTFYIFLIACTLIETLQFLKIYEATYDPWDLVAYISLLLPIYLIDLYQHKKIQGSH